MMKQTLFSFTILFVIFLKCTQTLGQGPAAAPAQVPPAPVQPTPTTPSSQAPVQPTPTTPSSQAPAALVQPSSDPLDVVKILQKASRFTVFVRLLQATGLNGELNKELNDTSNSATIFAPTDGAFSSLQAGFLNSLTDDQKTELVKFHVLPTFVATDQFQTISNPVRTEAGTGNRFSLNVITSGNFINITTGLTNTTISGTVYADNRLGIYQIDKVLFPLDMFTPKAPAPAPTAAVEKPKKKAPAATAETPVAATDVSGAVRFLGDNIGLAFLAGIGAMAASFLA